MKHHHYGTGILFCCLLMLSLLVQLIMPDVLFSKEENRRLATLPQPTLRSAADGSYAKQLEVYHADQFLNRYRWMKLQTRILLAMGQTKLQDITITKEGLLQEVAPLSNDVNGRQSADSINAFQEAHADLQLSFLMVPNAIGIYKERLHTPAVMDQEQLFYQFYELLDDRIQTLDTFQLLTDHKEEELFYRSDHHWTTLAASYAASMYLQQKLDYQVVVSNTHFQGTLAHQLAYDQFEDHLSLFLMQNDPDYVVDYGSEGKKTTTVYDMEKQMDSDAYAVYFGGNHPLIHISTTSQEDKRLLVFKDSYANCFLPFLLPYYSEITILDPRYYYEDINQLILDSQISDVLFLYNMNTFFSDHSLYELLSASVE